MNASEMAVLAAKALDAKRAKDIVALKVDEMTVITDYMVIATGRSVPQVKALCEHVEEELAKEDVFARRREGQKRRERHKRREAHSRFSSHFTTSSTRIDS